VELAIELGRDPSASREPRRKVFEPTLIVRQSTASPFVSSAEATTTDPAATATEGAAAAV
jgi:hypothetical protein